MGKKKASEWIFNFYNTMPRHILAGILYEAAMDRLKYHGTSEKEVWDELANDAGVELDWSDE